MAKLAENAPRWCIYTPNGAYHALMEATSIITNPYFAAPEGQWRNDVKPGKHLAKSL
ncbi:TPA: hypothetical protein QHK07_002040 [Klebsiella aerogenes]|nr:hypothetical protein [Klebsiella aerogenes]